MAEQKNGTSIFFCPSVIHLSGCLFILFVFSVAFLNPVYLDDIVYLMLGTRYLADDFQRTFVFVQCPSVFVQKIPFIFQPAAVLSAAIGSVIASPLELRAFGTLIFLSNLALLIRLRTALDSDSAGRYCSIFPYLFSVGLLPFLMLMARPEGILFLLLLLSCAISLQPTSVGYYSRFKKVAGIAVFLLLHTIMFWIHPGAVAFIPISVLCIYRLCPNRVSFTLSLVMLAAIVAVGVDMQSEAYKCPEVHSIENFFDHYSGRNIKNDSETAISVEAVADRLLAAMDYLPYVAAISPRVRYPYGIAPSAGEALPWLRYVTLVSVLSSLFLLATISILAGRRILRLVRKPQGIHFRHLLGLFFWATILLVSVLYPVKHPYRAITVYYLAAAGLTLLADKSILLKRVVRKLIIALAVLVQVSAGGVLALHGEDVIESLVAPRPKNHDTSVGLLSYQGLSDEIDRALVKCDINAENSRKVLVDGITYFAFRQSALLSLAHYSTWGIATETPPEEYLSNLDMEGLFVTCEHLPPYYESIVHRFGSICCWKNSSASD